MPTGPKGQKRPADVVNKGGVSQGSGLMSGRFIVHAIAVIGWLFAAVFAYAFLTLFGYFGVGFYGLLVLFICMQVELGRMGSPTISGRQVSASSKFLASG